jgi:lysophospholipase L1-like esterase
MRTSTGLSRRIALASISIAVAVAGLEAALRLLGAGPVAVNPDQGNIWTYHSQLGWTHRPGHRGVLDNDHFRIHVEINSQGLRGPEVAIQKPEPSRRVLVIGDSFAWGFGVEYEEIFATRLEAELPNTQVINGGVSGYSTDQALLWLRTEGRRYRHDVVIYVLSGNDDIMNHMQLAYWVYYKPTFALNREGDLRLRGVPVLRSSSGARFRHALRSRSAIAKAIEVALVGREASFVYLADSQPDPRDPHRLTVALVDAMREEAARAGASFVVVANSQFWFSPSGSHARLIDELRSAGHEVIDVEFEPGWEAEQMQIPGDGHWNAKGHEFVAGLVGEWLRSSPKDSPKTR